MDALEWDGADGWEEAQDVEWVVQGKPAGKVKQFGPLSFVQVYLAGHMVRAIVDALSWSSSEPWRSSVKRPPCGPPLPRQVPMDQALNSLAMITGWTRGQNLTKKQEPAPAGGQVAAAPRDESLPELFARLTAPLDPAAAAAAAQRTSSSSSSRAAKQQGATTKLHQTLVARGKHASLFVNKMLRAAHGKARRSGQNLVNSARRLVAHARRHARA